MKAPGPAGEKDHAEDDGGGHAAARGAVEACEADGEGAEEVEVIGDRDDIGEGERP